jgi:outer membrane protein insertion porin family
MGIRGQTGTVPRLKAASGKQEAQAGRASLPIPRQPVVCFLIALVLLAIVLPFTANAAALSDIGDFDGRPIAVVEVVFDGSPPDATAQADFLALLKVAANTDYSAARIHDSLQNLFGSPRVFSAQVEVTEVNGRKGGPLRVRFIIKRQAIITDIQINIAAVPGVPISPVSTDELRAQLNLIKPGTRASKQSVLRNVDEIQIYLRERGYFNATVDTKEVDDASGGRATVSYNITLGEQSKVAVFNIGITDFDVAKANAGLTLKPGAPFSRQALTADMDRIRQALIAGGYLAPILDEPKVVRDPETNSITITLQGKVGPKVNVAIENYSLSEKIARDLLPVKREGNIDQSAIVEGARRLRNKLQEQGYFFAEVTPVCSITPALTLAPGNGGQDACENLNPEDLGGHTVNITYQVDPGRRFRLKQIQITGTNKLTYDDVAAELKSQKANALGFIPYLGYGRGYTSKAQLEQDQRTINAHLRDFGYRHATIEVLQSVDLNGVDLNITFHVTEGPLTRLAGVEIRGNKVLAEPALRREVKSIVGAPYSPSQRRADLDRLLNLYARRGYLDADLTPSIVELPPKNGDEQVRVVYTIKNEGDQVFVNRLIVNGVTGDAATQRKKRAAIIQAIPLIEGALYRADQKAEAERVLFATDAYSQVIISSEQAGETAAGIKKVDVIIDVEEKKPRVMDYGGGYSTDMGPLGLFELSNVNLMNKLRQGAVRLRVSRRQQSVQFEYFDPHFAEYGKKKFAPLTLSVQYQRDSTVTRFFRSAIDRGTFGIVQRLDANGNAIDELGFKTGEPTINRFTFSAETQRVLDQKTRTILFARYSYEDVRLYNLESLLLEDILKPDRAIRLSRFSSSLVRDTRQRCDRQLPWSVEEPANANGEVCRFNQLDPTRGDFLSVDYSLALRQLGGNVSFSRFQTSYRRYKKVPSLHGAVLAANFTLGLASMFNPRDRDNTGTIDEIDGTLPISERFFSGGSTTLRGFSFEEAGPRQAITPDGLFRDQNKKVVQLNPFTVPVGGNALAIMNLEARVPLTRDLQVVPFYDGGNVFRRVNDLFHKRPTLNTTDVIARINDVNLRAHWANTIGLGFRIQTPLGGALAIDYGYLLNPPEFLVPQRGNGLAFDGTPAIFRLNRGQVHFRFTQTF